MVVKVPESFFLSLKEQAGEDAQALFFKAMEEAFLNKWDELTISTLDLFMTKKEAKKLSDQRTAVDLLKFFNEISGKNFKLIPANLKLIKSLLSDYREEDIKAVIINKTEQWGGHYELEKYLRPSTIFRRSNFDGYVNEPMSPKAFENKFKGELDALLGKGE